MRHQAGADHVVLHPVAGAADVKVHLVVPGLLGKPRRRRQFGRHAAAQLQRQRVLAFVVAKETLAIPVQQRTGGNHLGIEEGVARQLAQEETAVPIRPIHHGGHGEAAGQGGAGGFLGLGRFCKHQGTSVSRRHSPGGQPRILPVVTRMRPFRAALAPRAGTWQQLLLH
ncbi:hypothetical protein FQZ97_817760 [compost metagenome]